MSNKPKSSTDSISVVIPCYRTGQVIDELNSRLMTSLSKLTKKYQIIYVNDCSPDDTFAKLTAIAKKHKQVMAIDLMFNVGQFRAIMCGLKHAIGEYVVTMDDDLQHPPEEIHKLYNALVANDDLDVVIGKPAEKKHNIIRRFGSMLVNRFNSMIFDKPANIRMNSFRCLKKTAVASLLSHKTINPVLGPLILTVTSKSRIANVLFEHHLRKTCRSGYTFFHLIQVTVDNILNFSSLPLKIIGNIGITAFVGSLIMILWLLVRKFILNIDVPGWTSIILFINLYGGLILFSIGILGEYMIRIMNEVKGKPLYIEREIIS